MRTFVVDQVTANTGDCDDSKSINAAPPLLRPACMKYCPNCSAELGDQVPVPVCWNCQACFGSDPNWQPTPAPLGEFRKFTRVEARPEQVQVPRPRRETNRWGEVGLRLFRAAVIWLIGSAVLHASGLGEGVILLSWALVFWVLWPARHLIKSKGAKARDPGSAHGAGEPAPSIASGLVALVLRLLLAGAGFVVVLLMAIGSGYGDGAQSLFRFAWVLLIAAPLWALAPLVRAVMHRRKAADADFNASRRDRLRMSSMRAHRMYSRALGASLLLASPACFAHAPMPFDSMALLWVPLAILFGLFVLIGREKGAIAFFCMLGALYLWGGWESFLATRSMSETRTFVAQQCFAAGQNRVNERFAQPPRSIVVASDQELAAGSDRPALLREYLPSSSGEPGITFVRTLPATRDPAAGYVEIRMVRRPGSPAERWTAEGLRVTVTDGTGRVMGERTDFLREFGWCLGERPFVGVERLLRDVLGRPVGVEVQEPQVLATPAVISPTGRTGPLEKGLFHLTRLTDAEAGPHRAYDLRTQVVSFRSEDAWWTVSKAASDSRYFDSMDLNERSLDGALVRRWHLRFPPIDVGEHGGAFEVRNAAVRGRVLTADVLFDRRVETTATRTGPKPLSEWFRIKIPVTASLVAESPGDR